jgi:hypothetical protein
MKLLPFSCSNCGAQFTKPDNSTFSLSATINRHLADGDARHALLTSITSLAASSPRGYYNISSVQCSDIAGRVQTYNTSVLMSDFGFTLATLSFFQKGQSDEFPPSIASISVSPNSIATTLSAVNIFVQVNVTDDFAGATYCYVLFQVVGGGNSMGVGFGTSSICCFLPVRMAHRVVHCR